MIEKHEKVKNEINNEILIIKINNQNRNAKP